MTSPLGSDELLAVLPVDHPLADRASVPIVRLGQEPFIMPAGGCGPIITALARAARVRLRCYYEVRDTVSITSTVREGLVVHDAEPLPAALALMRLAEVRSAVRADHQAV